VPVIKNTKHPSDEVELNIHPEHEIIDDFYHEKSPKKQEKRYREEEHVKLVLGHYLVIQDFFPEKVVMKIRRVLGSFVNPLEKNDLYNNHDTRDKAGYHPQDAANIDPTENRRIVDDIYGDNARKGHVADARVGEPLDVVVVFFPDIRNKTVNMRAKIQQQ
jgi:hypothetical protein